jgi:hypothetical protein
MVTHNGFIMQHASSAGVQDLAAACPECREAAHPRVASMPAESLLILKQESGAFTLFTCMHHLLPQGPRSIQFIETLSDTIHLSGARTAAPPLEHHCWVLAVAAHQLEGRYPVRVPVHAPTFKVSPSFSSSPL